MTASRYHSGSLPTVTGRPIVREVGAGGVLASVSITLPPAGEPAISRMAGSADRA